LPALTIGGKERYFTRFIREVSRTATMTALGICPELLKNWIISMMVLPILSAWMLYG